VFSLQVVGGRNIQQLGELLQRFLHSFCVWPIMQAVFSPSSGICCNKYKRINDTIIFLLINSVTFKWNTILIILLSNVDILQKKSI
jgi:hypothetical protein